MLPKRRIPVTILTGFLGSGKTTLLRDLLSERRYAGTAVLINEFGPVSIDDQLLEKRKGRIVEVSTGCLCCTAADDTSATLQAMADARETGQAARFERLIIETTGLADPGPVIKALSDASPLAHSFRLAGVVTVIDAISGDWHLDRHPEALAQVRAADMLIVSKTDLVEDPASRRELAELRRRISSLNPSATIADAAADFNPGDVIKAYREMAPGATAPPPPHSHQHEKSLETFCLNFGPDIGSARLSRAIEYVLGAFGEDILRVKGLVFDPRRDQEIGVLQVSGNKLDNWTMRADPLAATGTSRVVFITRGVSQRAIEAHIARALSLPALINQG